MPSQIQKIKCSTALWFMLSNECALKHILKNQMVLIDNHQMDVRKTQWGCITCNGKLGDGTK